MEQQTIEVYTNNATFQLLEAAKNNRNKRHRQGYFFIEGVKAIDLALAVGWPLKGAVCARGRQLSGWGRQVLAAAPCVYSLAPELMEQLSERDETPELMLLGQLQTRSLTDIPHKSGLYMLLDRPQSPGNLGSVIRSADAFGADGLIVSGHSADVYDPQTIRASIGTVLTLPVACVNGPACLDEMRGWHPDIRFVGTSAKGEAPLHRCDLSGPVVLLMGNETDGLAWAYREGSDILARIPIQGAASSLNLASAASIALYEAHRQRGG